MQLYSPRPPRPWTGSPATDIVVTASPPPSPHYPIRSRIRLAKPGTCYDQGSQDPNRCLVGAAVGVVPPGGDDCHDVDCLGARDGSVGVERRAVRVRWLGVFVVHPAVDLRDSRSCAL